MLDICVYGTMEGTLTCMDMTINYHVSHLHVCGFSVAVGQSSASSQRLPNGCGSTAAMQATAAATLGRPHPITVSVSSV